MPATSLVRPTDRILITGSNGFIGSRVVERLLAAGFVNLRCLVRSSRNSPALATVISGFDAPTAEVVEGTLLSRDDCRNVTDGVSLIYHLAAGRGEKSYATAYMNSVVATRNLLDAAKDSGGVQRLVCVSSFAVYSTLKLRRGALVDETCEIEDQPHRRGEAYCYAKVRQDELVRAYQKEHGLPCVIVRPGVVYGPGNKGIPGRVGISTFGLFLHLGGSNNLPLVYVDNCADAIVLAGLTRGIDGEIFNIVDDGSPTSRAFLALYKRHVRRFASVALPRPLSLLLCYLWERYSERSGGQLPPVFTHRKWSAYWKGHRYSNAKLKALLGWEQRIPFAEGARRYFDSETHGGSLSC